MFTLILGLQGFLFPDTCLKKGNGKVYISPEQNLKLASTIFTKALKHEQNSSPVGKVDALLKQKYDNSGFRVFWFDTFF